jgi:hypothetical protein
MQGLGLCLWLVGAKSHPWTSIVREVHGSLRLKGQCRPHVRLQSHLKLATVPEVPSSAYAKITGGLFAVTTQFPGWPPLQTIELPVSLSIDHDEDTHLSLAHKFAVKPFTLEDVRKVEAILADHTDWEECALHPILANVTTPDPNKWRDISP